MNEEENKRNKRTILICVVFIVFAAAFFFLMDYFQTQSLLKKGIRANAEVTGKYCEVNTDTKDTSGYSMRLRVIADTGNVNSLVPGEVLSAFVKKKSFDKYKDGMTVKVVFKIDDADHARLVEEIE